MDDKEKEYGIARYLVSESGAVLVSNEDIDDRANTTPFPEMAHDLLLLVRELERKE